jgi:hypothetical protein
MISKKSAQALVTQARDGLVSAEQAIRKIIETSAWTALGYESFVAMWRQEFDGVQLASEGLRAAVVYKMFDGSATAAETSAALVSTGIGPAGVKKLKAVYDDGVPADLAPREIRVRSHLRARRGATQTIHVEISADQYAHFAAVAKRFDSDIRKEAEKAILTHFDFLERVGR